MNRKASIIVSSAFGIIFFLAMLPLQFDRGGYIPLLHSTISIFLNILSAVAFSAALYQFLRKKLLNNRRIVLYYLVLLAVAHGIYSVMFWSSAICLGIIAIWLVVMAILSVNRK